MSGDGSGLQGGVLTVDLGARSLGTRPLRPRRGGGRRGVGRRPTSSTRGSRSPRSSRAAGSWPPRPACRRSWRGRPVGRGEELVRLAETRSRVGVGNDEDIDVARANVGTYRDALRQLELAREQAIRALEILIGRYPAAALGVSAAAARRSPTPCRPDCRRSCSSAGPMSSPPSGASPPPSTASARPRRRGCRRSP